MKGYNYNMYIEELGKDNQLQELLKRGFMRFFPEETVLNFEPCQPDACIYLHIKKPTNRGVKEYLFRITDFNVEQVLKENEKQDDSTENDIRIFTRVFFSQVKNKNKKLVFPKYKKHMAKYYDELKKRNLQETAYYGIDATRNA